MQRLALTQSFHLALTPSLKEAISLLQLSSLELIYKMKEFSEMNPFFEMQWPYRTSQSPHFLPHSEAVLEDPAYGSLIFTLTQSLIHMKFSDAIFEAALGLIEDMDEHGFFSVQRFEKIDRLAQTAIDRWLRTVEPIGIGARSPLQSLIWQLKYRADFQKKAEALELLELLDTLADTQDWVTQSAQWQNALKAPRFRKIMASLYWNPRDLYQSPIEHDRTTYTVDLIIYQEHGEHCVRLNPENIPHIDIHPWPKDISKNHECRQYYKQALSFQRMIHTRWHTLEKLGKYLVHYQKDFFKFGKSALRPLILADIASALSLHESTISRILSQKNILTPFGVMELKHFLSRPIKKIYGEKSSRCAVLEILTNCIAHENHQNPYSDQDLTNILSQQGFCIARRTIAKYREHLHIASSHQRRTIKGDNYYAH